MVDYIWIVIALPLAGAVFLHFFGSRLREPLPGVIATSTIGLGFIYALIATADFFAGTGEAETVHLFDWIAPLGANAELLWDPLSAIMTLTVTGVGALIHLYSIGYMHGDARYGRFFTYLNFFAASMLILVLADNFGLLFVGWELVGLSSYLLISFWFHKPSAAAAGKKAFVVNRIGDVGFLIGLMLILAEFSTLTYGTVLEEPARVITTGMATAITLMLVLGAAGKSAQIPLYFWLPDAMEGPTPVSALIHAATMVTAGVYMVARTAALFELASFSAAAVATIGAFTALFAASIALKQRDIKRVLAYSTISQLGYMFLAVGTGAYVAGIFHLFTHAFFKALLFLGSGSVIHAMGGEQDIAKMGGLRKIMPVTHFTMAVGWLAIIGIPPLAGFWSKDEILAIAFGEGGWFTFLWVIGLITALLTAVYMTRWMYLTFWGEARWEDGVHPHESPAVMTAPLLALAVGSAGLGLLNTPWPFKPALEHFLEPSFEAIKMAHIPSGSTPWILAAVSILTAAAGAWFAYRKYQGADAFDIAPVMPRRTGVWRWVGNAYYVDDIIGNLIVLPGKLVAAWTAFVLDSEIIDGSVRAVGGGVRRIGGWLRPIQTGFTRNYAAVTFAGVVGLLLWFVTRGVG
ncbi:MAG: NADH-quinone oxidoreductase subunit L [Acidimicrobiia bacterium]|nr:MAG: NADH-quinone oxidoreductase subunit L [Acidimicrobiia bacterium]